MADEDECTGEQYWTAVSGRIRGLIKSLQRVYMPHVTEILLTGPFATNKRFHDAICTAFQDPDAYESVMASLEPRNDSFADQDESQLLASFATARGAAEIAKRRQEGPVQFAQSDESDF